MIVNCDWCNTSIPVQTPCVCPGPCDNGACPMVVSGEQPTYGPFGVRYSEERTAA